MAYLIRFSSSTSRGLDRNLDHWLLAYRCSSFRFRLAARGVFWIFIGDDFVLLHQARSIAYIRAPHSRETVVDVVDSTCQIWVIMPTGWYCQSLETGVANVAIDDLVAAAFGQTLVIHAIPIPVHVDLPVALLLWVRIWGVSWIDKRYLIKSSDLRQAVGIILTSVSSTVSKAEQNLLVFE